MSALFNAEHLWILYPSHPSDTDTDLSSDNIGGGVHPAAEHPGEQQGEAHVSLSEVSQMPQRVNQVQVPAAESSSKLACSQSLLT